MFLENFGRILAAATVLAVGAIVYSCGDDSSINDCSRRNKPQHYDRDTKEWTCRDKR